MGLQDVHIRSLAPTLLEGIIGPERTARLETTAALMREVLDDHRVINVNSTATGGGVAELLQTLLANARGLGVDARWLVIEGNPEFFAVTKRLHNRIYGTLGDAGPLGAAERRCYDAALAPNAEALVEMLQPGDIILLHDPQTAGLIGPVRAAGAGVVWRCHIGIDVPNEHAEEGWAFLRPYVEEADAFVFSCHQFAPSWIPTDRLFVIPPSIDPFSAKNEDIAPDDVQRCLQRVGVLAGEPDRQPPPFSRRDGSDGRVERPVDLLGTGDPPPPDVPLVLQASRWDGLKDMAGVMVAFAENLSEMGAAHLVLAGPSTEGVADDPEGEEVLARCLAVWRALPPVAQQRVHLACLPMVDGDEAASVVNALQRHARVVAQKSLAEGFGLTVTEAMWKGRPVVGSAVGGIVDQIVPGETGFLLADPLALDDFAAVVAGLLADPAEADRLGRAGRQRACEHFLGDRHLEQWAQVVGHLV